jgi:hypothetical protein
MIDQKASRRTNPFQESRAHHVQNLKTQQKLSSMLGSWWMFNTGDICTHVELLHNETLGFPRESCLGNI